MTFSATGGPGAPATLTAASAATQSAFVGAAVDDPPRVLVRDGHGLPVPGVEVTFEVTSGGGGVSGSPARTDGDGFASAAAWRLGLTPGDNTLTADVGALPAVVFRATAELGDPARIQPVAGDGPEGRPRTCRAHRRPASGSRMPAAPRCSAFP